MSSVPHTRVLALLACIVAAIFTQSAALAQSVLSSMTTRRDMVFDHAGKYLYITTSDGWVRAYNLLTGQLEPGFYLGGSPFGADISADDSFLLVTEGVASGSQGTLHKLNLTTGVVTNINYPLSFAEAGSYDVAIGANGLAFFTTRFNGNGSTFLRQVDLATNTVTVRTDVPTASSDHTVASPMVIHRNADGSRLLFLGTNDSSGPVFTYGAATNTFGPGVKAGMYFDYASGAVNRDGTLVGTLVGIQSVPVLAEPQMALDTAPDFHFVRSFYEPDSGIAFDPLADLLYAVSSSTGQIIAYDTRTFAEKYRLNIGEAVPPGVPQFGSGSLVASSDGRHLALATDSGFRLFNLPTVLPAPSPTPTPTLSTRRDMVFDHSGQFLYLTTFTGLVERYRLSTGDLEVVCDLGGSLNGLDIAPDDSFLLVAQNNIGLAEGAFQKVNLNTGAVVNITYPRVYPESGGWDVAIGSNGVALATTRIFRGFSAWTPPRQIDLATNAITIRNDAPGSGIPGPGIPYRGVRPRTQIQRSADGTRFYFLEPDISSGPIFTYDATTNTFGPDAQTWTYLDSVSAAVSRNGSLVATRNGSYAVTSLETAPNFNLRRTYNFDGGVAFDAVTDTLYGVDSSFDQVIAYDTNTLAEKYRLNIGENVSQQYLQFGTGVLVASNDGRYLALETDSGIRLLSVPINPPPPAPRPTSVFGIPRGMVFDHAGHYLYITTGTGLIWPYNLLTTRLETPYDLGGSLYGVDIAPDDSYLLVAQFDTGLIQGQFHKLNLSNRTTSDVHFTRNVGEGGGFDVAIASNGLALVTTLFQGSGWTPLRQIDLATTAISIRTDAPGSGPGGQVNGSAVIHRSADGTRVGLFESGIFIYSAASNTFGPRWTPPFPADYGAALNRDGSLVGTRNDNTTSLNTIPGFNLVHSFNGLNHAIAFDALQDVLYGVSTTSDEIIGYDTTTFAERVRVPVGEDIGAIPSPREFDTGTFVASQDGRYLALIAPSGVRVFDLATGTSSLISTLPYLGNISTRAMVGVGDDVPIGGFIIDGMDPKTVVVRAVGPSLASSGVTNALQDPVLELHDHTGAVIASDDNWRDLQEAQIQATGLAPIDDREAALVATLAPGSYTAVMRGSNDTTGVGVIELYDIDPNVKSRLANISTRGMVGTGDNVMIGGIILGGFDFPQFSIHERRIVVRGLGPSLTHFNIPNALQDPTLELHDGNGTIIRDNNDWADTQRAEIQATGLAPSNNLESAIIVALQPGNYTAILRGINNTSGVGLVEVYALP